MPHGGPSFTLKLKTQKVKTFSKRFNQEILQSTQLAKIAKTIYSYRHDS